MADVEANAEYARILGDLEELLAASAKGFADLADDDRVVIQGPAAPEVRRMTFENARVAAGLSIDVGQAAKKYAAKARMSEERPNRQVDG